MKEFYNDRYLYSNILVDEIKVRNKTYVRNINNNGIDPVAAFFIIDIIEDTDNLTIKNLTNNNILRFDDLKADTKIKLLNTEVTSGFCIEVGLNEIEVKTDGFVMVRLSHQQKYLGDGL